MKWKVIYEGKVVDYLDDLTYPSYEDALNQAQCSIDVELVEE